MATRYFSLQEAIKAQQALRHAAGLGEERFPVQAFVGMISDEVESLRRQGLSDGDIAELVRRHSAIDLTAAEITENFASADQRQRGQQLSRD